MTKQKVIVVVLATLVLAPLTMGTISLVSRQPALASPSENSDNPDNQQAVQSHSDSELPFHGSSVPWCAPEKGECLHYYHVQNNWGCGGVCGMNKAEWFVSDMWNCQGEAVYCTKTLGCYLCDL